MSTRSPGPDGAVAHVLIAGIPGTGKSEFARWLVRHHRFVRCPASEEPSHNFVREVNEALVRHPRVVIDWGFPANKPALTTCLRFIESWINQGVRAWWFDGDRNAALESFLARGTVSKADWDNQLAGINANWTEIEAAFAEHILDVVSAGPTYLKDQEKFQLVFPDEIAA